MKDRLKRILAFIIDWNLAMALVAAASCFLLIFPAMALLIFPLILAALALFVLRDLIFKGRSPGKRLLKLHVFDRSTLEPAAPKQQAVRNLFFFLYVIDGIILLSSGQSIGDRVAGTIVSTEKPTSSPSPVKKSRTAVIVIGVVAAFFLAILGFVLLMLNGQKDSEEYQAAYGYLVSSDAFEALGADESRIFMNSYSSRTQLDPEGGSPEKTVTMGFLVGSHSFEVVCHWEDGVWQVCEECTLFD